MKLELQLRILSSIFLLPISFYFVIKGSFFFNLLLAICFLISLYEWYLMSKKKPYFIYGIIYLPISFYLVYLLRNFNSCCNLDDPGLHFFLIVIITCVSTDLGGYIFGKVFKGPKLTKISPNKTYSGVLGSFILSIAFTSLLLQNSFFLIKISFDLIIFIVLISLVSQIGDIIISYFKRLSKIKNTGKFIPGHGGLLDRIDGMIFAIPFSYILLKLNIL